MTSLESIRFAQAEATAEADTPGDAAEAAYARLDRLTVDAPTRRAWDCRGGCAACCHLRVLVHPAEADRIAEHVRETISPADREALRVKCEEMAAFVRELGAGAYRRARPRCAFLDDEDRCSVYALRPLKCRAHVSRSVAACEDVEAPVPMDDWLVKAAEAVLTGLGDEPREELHAAVATRLRSV